MAVFFNGTNAERDMLLAILEKNCDCTPAAKCSVHKMLLSDQRALDGLVCERRRAQQLVDEEYLRNKKK